MTGLHKPVRRVSGVKQYERGKSRPIVVSLEPPGLVGFRLFGTRRTYRLPVGMLFILAARAQADIQKARKAAKRKAKKASKK